MRRYKELKNHIKKFEKVVVAFSGGIDSYLVLKAAVDSLGYEKVLAVTGDSASLKETEKAQTIALAHAIGVRQIFINTEELDNPDYYSNPNNRCFYCKDELFTKLEIFRTEMGFNAVLDGTNYDDLKEYRPGFKAGRNHKVISPLAELKFSKQEIREIARELGLVIWDKPSAPCLASRIPYGQWVTKEKLTQIESAEAVIKSYGFSDFRVRHFEFDQILNDGVRIKVRLAKIDISKDEIEKLFNNRLFEEVNNKIKKTGYNYVTIDIGGLKSGSMNLILNQKESEYKNN